MLVDFGKLIISSGTEADEDSSVDAVGFLVTESGILPVKLWVKEDDEYNCILGGAAFSNGTKDAQKLWYINIYLPKNEDSKYSYSALLKPVDDPKDKSRQLRSFLYRDYNVSNFFQGALFDSQEEEGKQEASPKSSAQTTGGTGSKKKRMF